MKIKVSPAAYLISIAATFITAFLSIGRSNTLAHELELKEKKGLEARISQIRDNINRQQFFTSNSKDQHQYLRFKSERVKPTRFKQSEQVWPNWANWNNWNNWSNW